MGEKVRYILCLVLFIVSMQAKQMESNLIDIFKTKCPNGYQPHFLNISELDDNLDYKIEINFSKTLELDCNSYFFTKASLKNETLEGFGYDYFLFDDSNSTLAGTKMFCGLTKEKKRVFFQEKIIKDYKSSDFIVIFTPKDINVSYKIFQKFKDGDF